MLSEHEENLAVPPLEDLPVRRLKYRSITIEGYSRAAFQTYWRIPEFRLGFDLGNQPWRFMGTPNWFISHAHIDHIAALPAYVARRRMMKMEPPVLYMPEEIVEGVQRVLHAVSRLDRGRLPCRLEGLTPGKEVELSRELVVQAVATYHTVPSLGYLVWERRKKLRDELVGQPEAKIRELALSGVAVSREVRIPRLAYLGDSRIDVLDANPELYEAEVLIMELTFVASKHRKEKIYKFGHVHLDDLIERRERFRNALIVASHFSIRYHPEQVERYVRKRLPDMLDGRLHLWL